MLRLLLIGLALTACQDSGPAAPARQNSGWYRATQTRLAATYANVAETVRQGDEIIVTDHVLWFPVAESETERTITRSAIRCGDMTMRAIESTLVFSDGRRRTHPAFEAGRRSLPPGSSGAQLLRFHCGETGLGTPLTGTIDEDFRGLAR